MESKGSGRIPRAAQAVKQHWIASYILGLAGWTIVCLLIVSLGWQDEVGTILRIACSITAWWFCWRFSRVTWSATDEGRHIMGYTLITAIFMTFATVVTIFGRFRGVDLLAIILYGWLLALLAERHRLFNEGQAERRLLEKEERERAGENA